MKPAAFLDRDGTVIVEKEYLSDPDGVELLPGAAAGLKLLRKRGFLLVLVTNQAGVGRGYYGEEAVTAVNARLHDLLLGAAGIALDGVYYCPHHPDAGCRCRKPAPGMLEQAVRDLRIDLERSVVIGDRPSDVELGRLCGGGGILVRTGYGAAHEESGACTPVFVADDLLAAARWLARRDRP